MTSRKPDPHELGELDAHLMREGRHPRLYDKLGALPAASGGTRFAVWAPGADAVDVIGDFNDWRRGAAPMVRIGDTGVWQAVIRTAGHGARYKYELSRDGVRFAKADPFARRQDLPPATASRVWHRGFTWSDDAWLASRARAGARDVPIAIYEVHLGSWRRSDADPWPTYRQLAPALVAHARKLGFTHVELMPLAEHPFYGSWGYEITGHFAPTARHGEPEDLMALIDALHRAGLGVILDWVPGHFPDDPHGLAHFDGGPLYEYADPRRGHHPEWHTRIFDYGREEVRSFLLSSAMAWIERFHVDGLRVDGVASMLYRDYGRRGGDWVANDQGGNENHEAVELLRRLNEAIHREHPGVITIAEESTAWPRVTGAVEAGGLGFDYKWDLGWMHDTLRYLARDPVHRKHHHGDLTMRGLYAFTEAYVLPLSHDEVVHGKGSLLAKMPGDRWQQLATLRLLYAYMYSQPGKKLLFMGAELAEPREWNHDGSLDWTLLDGPEHRAIQLTVGELDRLYRSEPALHQQDCEPDGFSWVVVEDAEHSVLVYERIGREGQRIMVALNFTPVPRPNYRIGVTTPGWWDELFNTDAVDLGGSGQGNFGSVEATPVCAHGREHSISLLLPPLAAVFLRPRPAVRAR